MTDALLVFNFSLKYHNFLMMETNYAEQTYAFTHTYYTPYKEDMEPIATSEFHVERTFASAS